MWIFWSGLCLALALLLGSSPAAGADLTVCSTGCDESNLIDSSRTWRTATYRVQEQIQVRTGATLTLEPGVTLRFTTHEMSLRVEGTLIARGTGNEGQALSFTLSGNSPGGAPLTFSASNLPPGASFGPASRRFSWTPTRDQAGTYPDVRFEVTNGTYTDMVSMA